jgi:hypothetical protein
MFPPPSQNTVGVCNQITLLNIYYIISRMVTLLKAMDVPIQVSDNYDFTASFTYIHTFIHTTYIHTYMHIYTHTYIHTHTHTTNYSGTRCLIKTKDWGKFEDKIVSILLSRFNCVNNFCDLTKCDEELGEKVKQSTDTDELMLNFTSIITANCDAAFEVSTVGYRSTRGRRITWWLRRFASRNRALALRNDCVVNSSKNTPWIT